MCHLTDNKTDKKYDLVRAIPDGALGLYTDKPGANGLVPWQLQRFCMCFEVSFSLS